MYMTQSQESIDAFLRSQPTTTRATTTTSTTTTTTPTTTTTVSATPSVSQKHSLAALIGQLKRDFILIVYICSIFCYHIAGGKIIIQNVEVHVESLSSSAKDPSNLKMCQKVQKTSRPTEVSSYRIIN